MDQKNQNRSKYILLTVLSILLLGVIITFPISLALDFASKNTYRLVIFGFSVFDIFTLLFLSIAEFASLFFDKTANKKTLFATIFFLIGILFSSDWFESVKYMGANITNELILMCSIVSNISLLIGIIFLFSFIQQDYEIKKYNIYHYFALSLPTILFILFSIIQLDIGVIIVTSLECGYIFFFIILYLIKLKGKNDNFAGYISLLIVSLVSVSLLFNALEFNTYIHLSSLGMVSFLFFIIYTGYIFIYVNYLIDKTKKTYNYEDKIKQSEINIDNKMEVRCFNSFDCFYKGNRVNFPSKKSKEFFALLVSLNGKALTMEKAITYLYPDKDIELAKRSYRDIVYKLRRYFQIIKFNGVTFKRAETILDISYINCDYLDVINKKKKYDSSSLMPEYDWSIELESTLENI